MITPNLFAMGLTVGTMGIGGEASYLVHNNFVLRFSGSYLAADLSLEDDNTACNIATCVTEKEKRDFALTGLFAGALLDWHPVRSGWRLTAGLRYVDLQFKSVDQSGRDIGKGRYTVEQVGAVRTTISNSSPASPYFGFGYDAAHFTRGSTSFSLGFDIGALYSGQPEVKIKTDKTPGGTNIASDLAAETQEVKSQFQKYYRFYPVFMLSGKLSF
jgi:hypothetical protein